MDYKKEMEELKEKRSLCYSPEDFQKEFDAILQKLPKFNEYVMFVGRTLYVSDTFTSKFNRELLIQDIREEKYRNKIFPSRSYGRLTFWAPVSLMISRYELPRHRISIECDYEYYEFPTNLEELWDIEDSLETLVFNKKSKLKDYNNISSKISTIEGIIKSEHYAELKRKREEKKRIEREKREKLEKQEQERIQKKKDRETLLALMSALSDKEFEKIVIPEYLKRLKNKLM